MSRRLALSLGALLVGTALLVASGLAAASNGADHARKGGTLRLSRFADVGYVDTALAYAAYSWPISFATCAKLFNYPDEPGTAGTRLAPEVVSGSRVSPDGRTYTFDLKRSFRFHNGAPVTAQSFADAFNRDADPRMRSPAVSYLHEIVGADAVLEGKARLISGVRVLGRYRLQIRLTEPLGDFTARLTLPFFCPVLPNTPVNADGIDNPAGSGPYYVAERVVNRRVVLKRNPYYRGGRPANVDEVVWTFGENSEACVLATEQDRIDYCPLALASNETYRNLHARYGVNRPGGQFFVRPSLSTWYLAFNHDRQAFKGAGQIPLKKAINYALDRPELARAFGYLAGRRTDQLLPPLLGRDEDFYSLKRPNLAAAQRWLAKARFKPDKLLLYTNNNQRLGGIGVAQVFAFNMKQLGIDVDVKYYDWPDALTQKAGTRGEPFDVVLSAWTVDYPDAASFFVPLIYELGRSNFSYFDDPAVNARIEAANRLTGPARRNAWADLDADLMRDNPPWAPFIHTLRREFISPSYGCYFFHPVYLIDLAAACKK